MAECFKVRLMLFSAITRIIFLSLCFIPWHIYLFTTSVPSYCQPPETAAHRNAPAEQPDGAVVSDALPHAPRLPVPPRVQRVVLQPADGNDRGKSGVQRGPGQEAPQGAEALPAQEDQGWRGEADAQEIRACGALSPLQETAISLRRLHGTGLVSYGTAAWKGSNHS